MPPRAKKLTKAEIERRKQEELERQRAEEAEKQRQLEEEEACKAKEQQRAEEEERERILAEEKARLDEERGVVERLLAEHEQALKVSAEEKQKTEEWIRYVSCEKLVDPRQATQVNSYINVWKEQSVEKSVDEILSECQEAQQVIDDIAAIMQSDIESPSPTELARYNEATERLQDTIMEKLNAVTLYTLRTPEGYIDEESQNTVVCSQSDHITFHLWGNVAKNPRIKEISFEKHGHFNLSLPKPLMVGNVAIRLVLLATDFLSSKSRTFLPSPEKNDEKKEVPKVSVISAADLEKPPGSATQSSTSLQASHPASKPASRIMSSANVERSVSATEVEDTSGVEGDIETTEDEAPDRASSTKSPVNDKLLSATVSKTSLAGECIETSEMDDSNIDDPGEVDLRNYRPLGGVFHLDLFNLPPQPRLAGTWTMQDAGLPTIEVLPYPPQFKQKPPSTPAVQSDKKGEQMALQSDADAEVAAEAAAMAALKEFNASHIIHVTLSIPQNVIFFEEPKLARWDSSKRHWRTDGYSNFVFDSEKGIFSFDTTSFGPYTLMQDLYLNTPLAGWSMMPTAPGRLLITIATTSADLEFVIEDELCCLSKAHSNKIIEAKQEEVHEKKSATKKRGEKEEKPPDPTFAQLLPIIGKAMSVSQLKEAMLKVGISIFPYVDGHRYVSVSKKDRSVESAIYREMALLSTACGFQWSMYNEKVRATEAVVQVCNLASNGDPQWFCFLLGDECWQMAIMEDSKNDEFSTDRAVDCQIHATAFEAITRSLKSPAIKEQVMTSSAGFVRVVLNFLEAVQPLVYS